jgi:hypothetical protein
LFEIDNMNTIARAKNIGTHKRIPATCGVAEMDACFQELAHGECWHGHAKFPLPVKPPQATVIKDTGAADTVMRQTQACV